MDRWMKYMILLVVLLVVLVLVCDAQRTTSRRRGAGRRSRNRGSGTSRGNSTNPTSGSRRRGSNRRRGGNRRPHPSCEEIYLPMCKGLVPYTHTKLPNRFNHTTQAEVYRVLEHKWAHMDLSCSKNMRVMICALYLPKCNGRRQGLPPCRRTCMAARSKCMRPLKRNMNVTWGDEYSCRAFPNRRCVRPVREKPCGYPHPECIRNSVMPICANLTFVWGTMPNMFQQCDMEEINTEVSYYNALRATNCHENLDFFLCGAFNPFCIRSEMPFTFPCGELCEEIRTACEPDYRRLYHDLPWPNKLQCHRYPYTTSPGYNCVMPNEGASFNGGR